MGNESRAVIQPQFQNGPWRARSEVGPVQFPVPFAQPSRYYRCMKNEVVQIDKNILGGTPCFAGTRVPIRSLFDHLKLGYSIDQFLEQFPTVKREQVDALLQQSSEQVEARARHLVGK